MVALLKAVANNAVGFAFSLAIDTVCPECSKIMQEFSQKSQLMNNLSINSCEMAQGLVGGVWPKGDLADKAICERSEEHTSELQSLMRISYAVFCLNKTKHHNTTVVN